MPEGTLGVLKYILSQWWKRGAYLCCRSWRVSHCFLSSAQLHHAFGAMSVEQVLCAAGRRLGASSMGDGGRCQAVLYVLVHVHSGWPRLPVEIRQKEFNSEFNILRSFIIKRPLFALAGNCFKHKIYLISSLLK